jgi:hypothetical protein
VYSDDSLLVISIKAGTTRGSSEPPHRCPCRFRNCAEFIVQTLEEKCDQLKCIGYRKMNQSGRKEYVEF